MHLYKGKRKGMLHWFGLAGVFLLSVLLLSVGSRQLADSSSREQQELLEEALSQATVACYATEGRYPANLEYLIEHYGIQINREKYLVTYEIFADNVRPRIRVLPIP